MNTICQNINSDDTGNVTGEYQKLKIIYVTIPITIMDNKFEKSTNNNTTTYYFKNRESKLQYQKEYNNKNKDTYLEYQKSYYDIKREDILNKKKEKVICECGRSISFGQLTNHKKTNLHLKNLNKNLKDTGIVIEDTTDNMDTNATGYLG